MKRRHWHDPNQHWATMGKQPKATVGRLWKAKRKEQKRNETKKEKKKQWKQEAKAQAECLERASPAAHNELRQRGKPSRTAGLGSMTQQEQAQF
jgi:hypothetical protein